MPLTVTKLRKALATNDTGTSFAAKIPTTTKPTGDGVFDLLSESLGVSVGETIPHFIQIIPYGTNGDNDTFDMRLIGWSRSTDATPVWVPQLLVDLNVVLGNISGAAIAANTFMADAITIAKGDGDAPEISPANDTPASILVHLRGCELIEFDWDLAGAQEGASMNAFWRLTDQ